MKIRWFAVMSLLLIAALAPAIGASAQEGEARLRVVHASPDAPSVDIWVNGSVAISDLAFKEATDYVALAPGDYDVQVTPAGATVDEAVIDATLMLEAGMDYTVAAVGQLENITPLVLKDDNTSPSDGMAHLRVVHASPDAPAVDVALAGGPVLIENLAFSDASSYLPVEAGPYDLAILPTGTDSSVLDIPGFVADSGTVYTVFAVGLAGDRSLSVLPLVDAVSQTGGTAEAPSMPNTGAGGTANDSSNAIVATVAVAGILGLAVISGALLLTRRGVSRA